MLDVDARDIESILQQTLRQVVARGLLPAEHRAAVESALLDRERQVSTAIGNAVAVPHAYLDALTEPLIVFVRLARPINLGAPDGVPTRFVFVLLGPTGRDRRASRFARHHRPPDVGRGIPLRRANCADGRGSAGGVGSFHRANHTQTGCCSRSHPKA